MKKIKIVVIVNFLLFFTIKSISERKISELPESLIAPIYFEIYSKLSSIQREINKLHQKRKRYREKYRLLVIERDKLREKIKTIREIAQRHQFKIEVIKKDFILKLYENNILVKSYSVAIGRKNKTKTGLYRVIASYEVGWFPQADWLPKIKKYRKVGLIVFSRDGKVIHGTRETWSLGKAVTSGCVRMKKDECLELVGLIPLGTIIEII